MTAADLTLAKQRAIAARGRFDSALVATQQRLKPANLAGEAWDGVKDKSADLADQALDAIKQRPATVSLALGALALFLARAPIKRAVSGLISGDEEGIEAADAELRETEQA